MNGNRVLFTLTLLAAGLALATLSGPAQAALIDDASTVGLWHMETIVGSGPGEYVPDDNSTGRVAHDLLLGRPDTVNGGTVAGSHPTVVAGALEFDGGDTATAPGTWDVMVDRVTTEFSFRPDALPDPAGDNYTGLVSLGVAQIYLQDDGTSNNTGRIQAILFCAPHGTAANYITDWTGGLALNAWHDVRLDVSGLVASLTVDGATTLLDLPDLMNTESDGGFWSTNGAVLGSMWYDPSMRLFTGALDEVKINGIPEPSTLVMVGLAGLAFALRRKV